MAGFAPTILIVGGVAGGASAAARARRCNEHARIVMFEQGEHVSFANCGLPYYIGGEIEDRSKLLLATPQRFRQRFGIDVHVRHRVTAIDRKQKRVTVENFESGHTAEHRYDKLILSPGASPIVPSLDGIDAANVFTLRDLHDTDHIKSFIGRDDVRRAVVVGGGFIGLEMVEMFHILDMQVSLVELQPQVLPPLDPEMAHLVQTELAKHHVDLHVGAGLAGFETDGQRATQVLLNSGHRIDADVVIVAIGVRPNTKLASDISLEIGKTGGIAVNEHLQTSDPDIYAVGDAVEYRHTVADMHMRIPLAGPANRAGRLAGEHAATGCGAAMAPVLGTAIVRVFGVTAAVTGCNMRCVEQMSGRARSIYVRHGHHVGYYPGAEPMTIKLLYDPDTQKPLGAQIVGGSGVDKRIDAIATALQCDATVQKLTELDLAYAPPFGAAKDPLHMAAFAAQNEIDGYVAFVPPGEALDDAQVVDVRTAAEVSKQPLVGAVHMPVDELRQRFVELDPTRPTVTVCASGQRSYLAARFLMQQGFTQVADLGGGMQMREHAEAARRAATVHNTGSGV